MRNIRRSERFEGIVRQLAEKPHSVINRTIFPTMRELLCFAAVLGFEHGRKKELDQKTNEIDGRTFLNSEQAMDVMCLIALCDAKKSDILRDENEDEVVSIFEQYVQGGLEVLSEWLNERAEDANGDTAILAALSKYKFLKQEKDPEESLNSVTF
ncbi:MAG: hypothetical protein PHR77_12440 [Kiritimatiellae bacterium]|nr:hypothetical protein [Kiritimatiellia bacterium]MDD5519519.1 hypothetical protein [Kiritimatiellia bacterium]